jgi:hypothetical protein
VLDETGQKRGSDDAPSMVDIALYTKFNESAVLDFGLDLSALTVFSASSQRLVEVAVRAALKHLTDRRMISIQQIRLQKAEGQDRAEILVAFVDLRSSSGEVNTATLQIGS